MWYVRYHFTVVPHLTEVRHTLELTLTCDHRILYGAQGAELLGAIAERLEAPTALIL
jgi:pyruvate dehydrogenase E2 component (dihydrolipoamide acetyltransferase)